MGVYLGANVQFFWHTKNCSHKIWYFIDLSCSQTQNNAPPNSIMVRLGECFAIILIRAFI